MVRPRREAPSAPPLGELLSEREAEGVRYEIWGCYNIRNDTLSVSPFGLPALPEGEPRALRAGRVPFIEQLNSPRSVSKKGVIPSGND